MWGVGSTSTCPSMITAAMIWVGSDRSGKTWISSRSWVGMGNLRKERGGWKGYQPAVSVAMARTATIAISGVVGANAADHSGSRAGAAPRA